MADNEEFNNQEKLLHLEALNSRVLASDQMAVQIGLFALKVIISVNGAALIAVLAVYPQLLKLPSFKNIIPIAGQFFTIGLIAGLLAAIIAYLYQSCITAEEWNEKHEIFSDELKPLPYPRVGRWTNILRILMIGLPVLAFVFFCIGSWCLLGAFAS